jgi:hypothetical protein
MNVKAENRPRICIKKILVLFCCRAGIRTPVIGARNQRPTTRRPGNLFRPNCITLYTYLQDILPNKLYLILHL